jgi:4-amino-4-deoxy-L-arabinose transferase-like glycosyltransferase
MLLTESIAPFCFTLAVWALLRTLHRPTGLGAAATGTALAVAALVRPNFLLFYPFVVLVAWWVHRRDVGKGLRAAGQILVCSVPLLALVSANNSLVVGRPTGISTNGGVNFFLMQADVRGMTFRDVGIRPVRNARYSTMVSSPVPFSDEAYFYKQGVREFLARRDKVGHVLTNIAEGFGLGQQGYWPGNLPLSGEDSAATADRTKRILRLCSQGFFWVVILPTVLGVAWAGLRRPRLRRLEIQSVLAASIVIVLVVTSVVLLADPRMHVPFDPILIACLATTFSRSITEKPA